ncbi:uncharacterized protein LAJ45_05143 [Morchella importuna]|uniref:uncharacterized protein n=1 Tax=Morchella importuna TaxID=1174673 RepID=UPI001E8D2E0C|nr:uncharacterized protein LAJ45_05143 [Morchella importuna]KAH8150960.1 hypothetical protein LAJ45_05143 [Morchella importuna]
MKTVSTLCATSTVGIAACGFALARPCKPNDAHDQLTNPNTITTTTNTNTNNTTPIIREPETVTPRSEKRKSARKSWGGYYGSGSSSGSGNHNTNNNTNNNNGQTLFPEEPSPRTSTSRRWLHRLSESFSSSSSSSSTPSSPTSSTSQSRSTSSFSSRSRPYTSSSLVPFGARRSSSRPRTGNKLVKRNPSSRNAVRPAEDGGEHDSPTSSTTGSPTRPAAVPAATTPPQPTTPAAANHHHSPSHRQRPSTAGVHQSFAQSQSSPISPIHASRPSTSALFSHSAASHRHQEQALAQPPPPTTSWRGFFTPKRHKPSSSKYTSTTSPSTPSSPGGLKLPRKPFSGVRRIYPKQLQKNGGSGRGELIGPTLMLAPTPATTQQQHQQHLLLNIDIDSESVFSGAESSLFFDSRPASRMDDLVELAAVRRSSTGMALGMGMGMGMGATSPRNSARRRSLSGRAGFRVWEDGRSVVPAGTDAAASCATGTHATSTTTHTTHHNTFHTHSHTTTSTSPSSSNTHSPSSHHHYHYYHTRSASHEEDIPPVPSLPQLDGNMDFVSRAYSPDPDQQQQEGEDEEENGDRHESSLSPEDSDNGDDDDADVDDDMHHHHHDFDLDLDDGENIVPLSISDRQHRLSLISASERASTLVGSEDNMEDFQSDTVFDSLRTRASELTPRADQLFDQQQDEPFGSGLEHHHHHHAPHPLRYKHYVSGEFGSLKNRDNSSSNMHATTTTSNAHKAFDDDEDGSSSDWDAPSRNGDDDGMRIVSGGLRPYSGLLSAASLGLHSNNASSTSFGTAPEGFSINDGSSIRETNSSILDWSESVSPTPQPQPSYAKRSKTIHAKESIMLTSSRSGRRAPSYHVRSQSMPLVNSHGRVPLPSENWDEDFLDDDDEGGCLNMVIPRAIEEQQASVIGHLGCVREFALLVEDLKHLRSLAISSGVRNGVHQAIFDEAEGIIALATLDDDQPIPAVPEAPSRTPPSKGSHRRSSILLPDDDVFGGGGIGAPSTPLLRRSFGHTPPNISPQSRKTIDRNDPVEVAKGIMERMQQSGGHHVRGQSDDAIVTGKPKKVQFDTDMLRELVKHVGKLKRTMQSIVDDARDLVESPLDMEDGFECRGSFEGFEEGWEFSRGAAAAGHLVGVV